MFNNKLHSSARAVFLFSVNVFSTPTRHVLSPISHRVLVNWLPGGGIDNFHYTAEECSQQLVRVASVEPNPRDDCSIGTVNHRVAATAEPSTVGHLLPWTERPNGGLGQRTRKAGPRRMIYLADTGNGATTPVL